uniref:Acetyltransferase n=1 Tax=Macrostomum lignano TaxID=282301 RepID=A0A1I8GVN9_9PLAT
MRWTEQLADLLLCPTGDQDEAAGNAAFVAMLNGLAENCGEPCDIDGWTDEQLNSFVLAPAAAVGPGTRRLLCPRERDDRDSFFSSLRFRLRPLAHLGAAALAALRRLGLCFAVLSHGMPNLSPGLPMPHCGAAFPTAVIASASAPIC